jgi:hypothetical protein
MLADHESVSVSAFHELAEMPGAPQRAKAAKKLLCAEVRLAKAA